MMADFATVAELETFMGTTGLGARGTAMLGYASAQIRRYCGGLILETFTGRQEEFAGSEDKILFLTQRPVTAVTAITENAITMASTEYVWSRWGTLERRNEGAWDLGPIVVTYDGAPTADDVANVKSVCLEMAARALGGAQDTFGSDIPELRGAPVLLFMTDEEKRLLADFAPVPVG
jgi:hypothetical protein